MGDMQVQGLKGTVSLKSPPWMGGNSRKLQSRSSMHDWQGSLQYLLQEGDSSEFCPQSAVSCFFHHGVEPCKTCKFQIFFSYLFVFCILFASFQDSTFQLERLAIWGVVIKYPRTALIFHHCSVTTQCHPYTLLTGKTTHQLSSCEPSFLDTWNNGTRRDVVLH